MAWTRSTVRWSQHWPGIKHPTPSHPHCKGLQALLETPSHISVFNIIWMNLANHAHNQVILHVCHPPVHQLLQIYIKRNSTRRFFKISEGGNLSKSLSVVVFFSRLLAPLWNLIFSQFLKPTTDELVVGCQYMTYDRLCLEYFHRGLQLLESSNKQIYVIYGLIAGHWQVLVCLDGCWSTPIDLLHHRHHTSPLLVEEEIMQDCTTPYHPQYCTTPYHPQNTQFFHTTQKYT